MEIVFLPLKNKRIKEFSGFYQPPFLGMLVPGTINSAKDKRELLEG